MSGGGSQIAYRIIGSGAIWVLAVMLTEQVSAIPHYNNYMGNGKILRFVWYLPRG